MPVAINRIRDAVQDIRRPPLPRRPRLPAVAVAHGRVSGAATFLVGALAAFLWANTTAAPSYEALRRLAFTVSVGGARLVLDFRTLVNDALMALFFFSIALALRRRLSSTGVGRPGFIVPAVAAAAALVLPAIALGVIGGLTGARLALAAGGFDLGLALAAYGIAHVNPDAGRHPVFIFSAAIDGVWMGALLIIGLWGASWPALVACGAIYLGALGSRWIGARGAAWGLPAAALLWLAWRETALPPALAGALIAALVPGRSAADERRATELAEDTIDDFDRAMDDSDLERCSSLARRLGDIAASAESPIDRWQAGVLPWLTWVVLPLFGLVNGGIRMAGLPLLGRVELFVFALVAGRALAVLLAGRVLRRRVERDPAEADSADRVPALASLVPIGGVPAMIGILIVMPESPLRDAYLFAVAALAVCAAALGGLALRFLSRTGS